MQDKPWLTESCVHGHTTDIHDRPWLTDSCIRGHTTDIHNKPWLLTNSHVCGHTTNEQVSHVIMLFDMIYLIQGINTPRDYLV